MVREQHGLLFALILNLSATQNPKDASVHKAEAVVMPEQAIITARHSHAGGMGNLHHDPGRAAGIWRCSDLLPAVDPGG